MIRTLIGCAMSSSCPPSPPRPRTVAPTSPSPSTPRASSRPPRPPHPAARRGRPTRRSRVGRGRPLQRQRGVVLFSSSCTARPVMPRISRRATAGADELLAALDSETDAGLYTGLAGIGFVLERSRARTGDAKYRDGARRVVDAAARRARCERGAGVEWNDTTDIICGIGGHRAVPAARRRGARRARRARPRGARRTPAARARPRRCRRPQVADGRHVGAAAAQLLARHRGRRLLPGDALPGDEGPRVPGRRARRRRLPEGDRQHRWRHVPDLPPRAGRGRASLYYLGLVPRPRRHRAALVSAVAGHRGPCVAGVGVEVGARHRRRAASPTGRRRASGTTSASCCGSAGVAEFFLAHHRATGDATSLAFARRVSAQILGAAVRDASGIRWPHAEHRDASGRESSPRPAGCRAPPASARGSCTSTPSSAALPHPSASPTSRSDLPFATAT